MTRQIGCVTLLLMFLSGCSTLGYYAQALQGQTSILLARQSVDGLLRNADTPVQLQDRLILSQGMLAFAESNLGLPVAGRYRAYVATGRDAVVWNVFAAPEFGMTPLNWCYPVVGCVPYRGYFRQARARRHADRLVRQGYSVHVGGVAAYSTLGWFRDPLLDTFINWPEAHLANLLFHELAHGRVWVAGDAVFNESLASFVGDAGAQAWLADRPQELSRYRRDQDAEAAFSAELLSLRARLSEAYEESVDAARKRERRDELLAGFRACYARRREALGGGRFDAVVRSNLNNAFLASRQTYTQHEAAFALLFKEAGDDWNAFWRVVEDLTRVSLEARVQTLEALSARAGARSDEQQVAHAGDDDHADEVHCEAFPGHVAG